MCYGCHRVIDKEKEEKERLARMYLGDERYEALMLRAHKPNKTTSVRMPVSARPGFKQTPKPGRGGSISHGDHRTVTGGQL
jgi:hypothetical protein